MTIPIEPANTSSDIVTSGLSRYIDKQVIRYGDQKFLTFKTYVREEYKPNGKEKVMLITPGVEYRPDLVSFDVYGFVDAWWKLLEVNGMKDIWEFKAGKTILIPSLN